MPSSSTTNKPPITVGIDVGAESTKVTLGSRYACEIVRNDVGGHTTPSAVSFLNKTRHMGETANLRGANAIIQLNRLLDIKSLEEEDLLKDFYMFEYNNKDNNDDNILTVQVDYNGDRQAFSAPAILAMLLGKIKSCVWATIQRVKPHDEIVSQGDIQYLLSICPQTVPGTLAQWLEAAHAAGLEQVQLVETSTAYAAAYERKFPEAHVENGGKVVMMVDMGHGQTTCSIVQFGATKEEEEKDEAAEKKDNEEAEKKDEDDRTHFRVLAASSNSKLGASCVDIRLFHHFQSTVPALKTVQPNSRAGQRLLQGTHKLKHLLSQLPEGSVTVENVGEHDSDISLSATRTLVSELCEPDAQALTELIQSTLNHAGVEKQLDSVEVLGGGCRIPWVQSTISSVVATTGSNTSTMTLSRSLDDTSAALGAALVGEQQTTSTTSSKQQLTLNIADIPVNQERRQQLKSQEETMAALDMDQKIIGDTRNQLESHILHLRSARDGKHGSLLPDNLNQYLDELDDWLFSPECDDATKDDMLAKWKQVQDKTQEMCKDYLEAVAADQKAQEQEMEAAAKQAQAEYAAGGGGEEDEDHDTRRLPKKRRMEIVMKNKEEANELFKDGNWRFAAARYTKALSHCAKFVDLSPDDIQEVNGIKVTLNLNLALAYMKLAVDAPIPNLDNALRVCNDALALDESSAKALYRRASIYYEKKNWDAAKKDILQAKKIAGESDKAIQKLGDRIELQLKKQKQKEKKMASKMFG